MVYGDRLAVVVWVPGGPWARLRSCAVSQNLFMNEAVKGQWSMVMGHMSRVIGGSRVKGHRS